MSLRGILLKQWVLTDEEMSLQAPSPHQQHPRETHNALLATEREITGLSLHI